MWQCTPSTIITLKKRKKEMAEKDLGTFQCVRLTLPLVLIQKLSKKGNAIYLKMFWQCPAWRRGRSREGIIGQDGKCLRESTRKRSTTYHECRGRDVPLTWLLPGDKMSSGKKTTRNANYPGAGLCAMVTDTRNSWAFTKQTERGSQENTTLTP
jgi:hypothetical protein